MLEQRLYKFREDGYLLEFVGVTQDPSTGCTRFGDLIQVMRVGRIWKPSLGNGSNKDLQQWGEGTTSGCPVAIKGPSRYKNEQGEGHDSSEDKICNTPIHMVLYIHNEGHPQNKARTETTAPPIEE